MSDPTEIRNLQRMGEENTRQIKRQPLWDTRPNPNASGVSVQVHQVAHGLSFGQAVTSIGLTSWIAVTNANAASYRPYSSNVIGIIVAVSGPNDFVVGLSGTFPDPTGAFAGGLLGSPYYLTSTPGALSQTAPSPQYMMAVLVPLTGNRIFILGGNALLEMRNVADLADIHIGLRTTLADGDVIRYEALSSLWVNKPNTVANLVDAVITSPSNGDQLTFDSTSSKWKNVAGASTTHAATSVVGRSANTTGAAADIAASSDNTALLRISGALTFAAIPNAALANSTLTIIGTSPIVIGGTNALGGTTTVAVSDATTGAKGVVQLAGDLSGTAIAPTIATNAVTPAKLAQAAATTILGNPTNTLANVTGIASSADGQVLRQAGGALGFGLPPIQYTNKQVYTASTTFTVPAGVYCIFAVAIGGGAGSWGTGGTTTPGVFVGSPGGGAGAGALGFIPVAPGQVLTITVGTGGSAGAAGGTGGSGGTSSITGSSPTVALTALGGSPGAAGTLNGIGGLANASYPIGCWGAPGGTGYPGGLATAFSSAGGALTNVQSLGGYGGVPSVGLTATSGRGAVGQSTPSSTGVAGNDGAVAIFY